MASLSRGGKGISGNPSRGGFRSPSTGGPSTAPAPSTPAPTPAPSPAPLSAPPSSARQAGDAAGLRGPSTKGPISQGGPGIVGDTGGVGLKTGPTSAVVPPAFKTPTTNLGFAPGSPGYERAKREGLSTQFVSNQELAAQVAAAQNRQGVVTKQASASTPVMAQGRPSSEPTLKPTKTPVVGDVGRIGNILDQPIMSEETANASARQELSRSVTQQARLAQRSDARGQVGFGQTTKPRQRINVKVELQKDAKVSVPIQIPLGLSGAQSTVTQGDFPELQNRTDMSKLRERTDLTTEQRIKDILRVDQLDKRSEELLKSADESKRTEGKFLGVDAGIRRNIAKIATKGPELAAATGAAVFAIEAGVAAIASTVVGSRFLASPAVQATGSILKAAGPVVVAADVAIDVKKSEKPYQTFGEKIVDVAEIGVGSKLASSATQTEKFKQIFGNPRARVETVKKINENFDVAERKVLDVFERALNKVIPSASPKPRKLTPAELAPENEVIAGLSEGKKKEIINVYVDEAVEKFGSGAVAQAFPKGTVRSANDEDVAARFAKRTKEKLGRIVKKEFGTQTEIGRESLGIEGEKLADVKPKERLAGFARRDLPRTVETSEGGTIQVSTAREQARRKLNAVIEGDRLAKKPQDVTDLIEYTQNLLRVQSVTATARPQREIAKRALKEVEEAAQTIKDKGLFLQPATPPERPIPIRTKAPPIEDLLPERGPTIRSTTKQGERLLARGTKVEVETFESPSSAAKKRGTIEFSDGKTRITDVFQDSTKTAEFIPRATSTPPKQNPLQKIFNKFRTPESRAQTFKEANAQASKLPITTLPQTTSAIPTTKTQAPSSIFNTPTPRQSSVVPSSTPSSSKVPTSSIPSTSSASSNTPSNTPQPSKVPSKVPPSTPPPSKITSQISSSFRSFFTSTPPPSSITPPSSFFDFTPPPTTYTPPPQFPFVPPSFGERGRPRVAKKRKQPKGFKPTLFSSVFNIRGSRSAIGELSGLGARPLPTTKIKKPKKRKKSKKK